MDRPAIPTPHPKQGPSFSRPSKSDATTRDTVSWEAKIARERERGAKTFIEFVKVLRCASHRYFQQHRRISKTPS